MSYSKNVLPTVVIALGGAGKRIVLELKKKYQEAGIAINKETLKILCIDMDYSVPVLDNSISLEHDELLRLKSDGFFMDDNFEDIESWFPRSQTIYLRKELNYAPSQDRAMGRFCFYWNSDLIQMKLMSLLSEMAYSCCEKELDSINVYVCGSLSGATGSGMFLDIAYSIQNVIKNLTINVITYGMFGLSSIFNNCNDIMYANCFAALTELNHFSDKVVFQNKDLHFPPTYKNINRLKRPDIFSDLDRKPFDYTYLFDKTDDDKNISFFKDVANYIYLCTYKEINNQIFSLDNNIKSFAAKFLNTDKPFDYKAVGYSKMKASEYTDISDIDMLIKNATPKIDLDGELKFDNQSPSTIFIFIPNIYENIACLGRLPRKTSCNLTDCPHFTNCLLNAVNQMPIENKMVSTVNGLDEIVVVKVIHLYELNMLKTLKTECKPAYDKLIKIQESINKENSCNEENLHIFGNVKFNSIY